MNAPVADVMTLRQAAAYLRITIDTLYSLIQRDRSLPCFKLGNRWRFQKSSLDRWMDERSERTACNA
jgi:excisionase family DNA binding protein